MSKEVVPAEDSDLWDPTMAEMREALEDPGHPRHADAVRRNKELANKLVPNLEALRKTMGAGRASIDASMAKIAGTMKPAWQPPSSPHMVDWQRSLDETRESIAQAAQERAAHQQEVDDRAVRTLDVLEAMNASLGALEERMGSIDGRLNEGNRGATTAFRWTLAVGVATLVATVVGIVVTVLLST